MTQEPASQDKNYSKAEVAGMVQASLALCATCAHSRGEHEGEKSCLSSWETGDEGQKTRHECKCIEYWPQRDQREDGRAVIGHALSIGGGVDLVLDRRAPTELWDGLTAGTHLRIELELVVDGKGFRAKREKGFLVGLTELRKLKVVDICLPPAVDRETGEIVS